MTPAARSHGYIEYPELALSLCVSTPRRRRATTDRRIRPLHPVQRSLRDCVDRLTAPAETPRDRQYLMGPVRLAVKVTLPLVHPLAWTMKYPFAAR